MIVAIDGLDGSGKSRFAAALAAACAAEGAPARLLHVDDFRRDLDFTGLDAQVEGALDYERYYDLAALDGQLAAFREHCSGRARLAIVEGVFTLRIPAVDAAAALIVLTVSYDEARRRILERDRAKGRNEEEIRRRIARRYFPARERYRAECDPEGRADAVVDNEDWRAPRLGRRVPGRLPAPVDLVLNRLAAIGA